MLQVKGLKNYPKEDDETIIPTTMNLKLKDN